MRKTRKVGKQKQFRQKHTLKRLARGKEDMVSVWLRKKLNDVNVRTNAQEFADNDRGITSNILKYLPKENNSRVQTVKVFYLFNFLYSF